MKVPGNKILSTQGELSFPAEFSSFFKTVGKKGKEKQTNLRGWVV